MFATIFIFVAWLMVLFSVITDLFRDHTLSGAAKAIWLVLLIFVPVLTVLIYLIVRGEGMGKRAQARAAASKAVTDEYIRSVSSSPAEEIATAKQLLDSGVITASEFETLKAKALA